MDESSSKSEYRLLAAPARTVKAAPEPPAKSIPFLYEHARLGLFTVNQWTLLALLFVSGLTNTTVGGGFVPACVDAMQTHFNVTNFQIGLVGSMGTFTNTIASMPVSHAIFMIFRLKILGLSFILLACSVFLLGAARLYWQLVVAAALTGIFSAPLGVYGPPLLQEICNPKHKTKFVGVFFLTIPLGAAVGFGLGGYISQNISWRWCFYSAAVVEVVIGIAWLFFSPRPEAAKVDGTARKRTFLQQVMICLRHPIYMCLVFATSAVSFVVSGLGFWLPKMLKNRFHLDSTKAGIYVGASVVPPAIIGIALFSFLADRAAKKKPLPRDKAKARLLICLICVVIAYPFGVAAIFMKKLLFFCLLLAVAMLTSFGILSPAMTLTLELIPLAERTMASAVLSVATAILGQIPGPLIVGAILDLNNDNYVMTFEIVLLLILVMLVFLIIARIMASKLGDKYFPETESHPVKEQLDLFEDDPEVEEPIVEKPDEELY